MPGSRGHAEARQLILDRFAALGLVPYQGLDGYEHTFVARRDGITMRNILGVIPGRRPRGGPLLIGAHYDSVIAAPSANDNAAAVAVMLAVAERLQEYPPERDVIIAAFDAEEPPYFLTPDMGSARFVADALAKPVHMALILDLIGHPLVLPPLPLDPHLLFVIGAETHPALPEVLQGLSLPIIPTRYERVGSFSDYDAFRSAGAPFLFFSGGEWPDYHTAGDTADLLDFAKLERLVADLVKVLTEADQAELGEQRDHDTTAIELRALRVHLGQAALNAVAARLGLESITTREDLDIVIPALRRLAGSGGA
jgi:Zn-dependent M28 family amino/carboxypeptidase